MSELSTVFLKHRNKWDSVSGAVRSLTWSQGADEVIGRCVPTTVVRSRSRDKQWFDASCRRVCHAKQSAYRSGVEHVMLNIGVNLCLLVLRLRGSMMLHMSRIMSAPGII